ARVDPAEGGFKRRDFFDFSLVEHPVAVGVELGDRRLGGSRVDIGDRQPRRPSTAPGEEYATPNTANECNLAHARIPVKEKQGLVLRLQLPVDKGTTRGGLEYVPFVVNFELGKVPPIEHSV